MPFFFPGDMIEVFIDGAELPGPGGPGPFPTDIPFPTYNDTGYFNDTDPLCPGPSCPDNFPNATQSPGGPQPTPGGPSGPGTMQIPVIFFSVYFPTFWQNYTAGSDAYFAYFYALEAAIVELSGLPDTLVLVAEDDVPPEGWEIRAALYYVPPDWGMADANAFMGMSAGGGLAAELDALMAGARRRAAKRALLQTVGGLYDPGEVDVAEPEMVMLPYDPATGLLPTLDVGTPSRPTRPPPRPDARPVFDYEDDYEDYGNGTAAPVRPVPAPAPQPGAGPAPAIVYVDRPLFAVAAFFVRFGALNYDTLASTPGAGEELCDFYRCAAPGPLANSAVASRQEIQRALPRAV